jgi:hypothetical protein
MDAPFKFNLGDIYQAKFPFEEDESRYKERAVFVWRVHNNQNEVLTKPFPSRKKSRDDIIAWR